LGITALGITALGISPRGISPLGIAALGIAALGIAPSDISARDIPPRAISPKAAAQIGGGAGPAPDAGFSPAHAHPGTIPGMIPGTGAAQAPASPASVFTRSRPSWRIQATGQACAPSGRSPPKSTPAWAAPARASRNAADAAPKPGDASWGEASAGEASRGDTSRGEANPKPNRAISAAISAIPTPSCITPSRITSRAPAEAASSSHAIA
jgi:hypothetical protein